MHLYKNKIVETRIRVSFYDLLFTLTLFLT